VDLDTLNGPVAALVDERGLAVVVRVSVAGEVAVELARGASDRRHGIANAPDTRFGLASGTKGFTALLVAALIDGGVLSFDEPARTFLGDDLPLVDDRVTIGHLLEHRAGIGDYLDESETDDTNAHLLPVPVHQLAACEDYLLVLGGRPQVSPPGERFAYNNSGYVILAVIAERATGRPYTDLVRDLVCRPAGLESTGFVRTDELPPETAVGYLEPCGLRSNVLHLPVLGLGDGGIISTVGDVERLWRAVFEGRVVAAPLVDRLTELRSIVDERTGYGAGFWLARPGPQIWLEGSDPGISFWSMHDPTTALTATVVSNTTSGAWPVARLLDETVRAASV